MIYCIKVDRSGIVEEDIVLHHAFESKPTRQEIEEFILGEDIGYDPDYCDFDFYRVD